MYNSDYPSQPPQPRKRHRVRNVLLGILGALAALIILLVALAPASTTKPAGPPAATHSATAQPAATASPAAPRALLSFTGHGNESTPSFTASGDFTVSWAYSGNVDDSIPGSPQPDNFSAVMNTPGQGEDVAFNGPNDIQASGSGNQTVSGDSGSHYFTVQASGASTWTVKVLTAP